MSKFSIRQFLCDRGYYTSAVFIASKKAFYTTWLPLETNLVDFARDCGVVVVDTEVYPTKLWVKFTK